MKIISIELADPAAAAENPAWWKQVMALFLKPGQAFEIRCWREELTSIESASAWGRVSEKDSTAFEVSIRGTLTEAAAEALLQDGGWPEENRMTAFFTLRAGGAVSSEHYGRELFVFDPTEEVLGQLKKILTPLQAYFILGGSEG